MPFATWSESLRIGIDFVDTDHKRLFEIVNRLHTAMTEAKGREAVKGILKELHDYSESHFKREEAMLDTKNYPGLGDHKKLHANFVSKIDELAQKSMAGNNLVSIELLKFLRTWLVGHIAEDDKLYRAYLDKIGVLTAPNI